MKTAAWIVSGIGALVLAAVLAVHTGAAHRVFFELYAFVKGDGLVAPTVYRLPPDHSPYERWLRRIRSDWPVYEGTVLHDIGRVDLPPWPAQGDGVRGLYLRFADYQMTDGRLLELPAGGATDSARHLYEAGVYVLRGSGFTTLALDERESLRVDWSEGDLFAIPLNVRYRHHNRGANPARLLAVTSFPMMTNLVDDEDFVLRNRHVFRDRYDGEADYLRRTEALTDFRSATNIVRDVPSVSTVPNTGDSHADRFMHWRMAGNSMLSMHVSDIPARTRLHAHRHSSDAFILMLAGEGFSLAWPEGRWDDRIRVDWSPGTLFVPPTYWYHQHFNTGPEASRHLAINVPDVVRHLGLNFNDELKLNLPETDAIWEEALQNRGTANGEAAVVR